MRMELAVKEVCVAFDEAISDIHRDIHKLEFEVDGRELLFQTIKESINNLKFRAMTQLILLSHDTKKKYEETINALEESVETEKCSLCSLPALSDTLELVDPVGRQDGRITTNSDPVQGFVTYKNMENEILSIKNCSGAHVVVYGGCKTARIRRVYHSIIYITGMVEHEIQVVDCEDLTLIAKCQQLRIETATSSTFFVDSISQKGIAVQESRDISFGFHPDTNTKPMVTDFSSSFWNDSPSPNFKYIIKEQSIKKITVEYNKIHLA
ncbi:hypothetical protein RF11_00304 [Thelohanellus kitauei]|uniref:C-CAP/cofactor C-like domain-containing protein n=1 Tax=Thelohanellus kitauei TaxID=669202 RepID=A0A0C2J9N4_THEKT|nr:hypothetical protein RF11_00304 [Thelohanellus kitauei]